MRHGLFSLAALLLSVTLVQAEYVRFLYNPGLVKQQQEMPAQPGQPGQPVFQPRPGQPGFQPGGPPPQPMFQPMQPGQPGQPMIPGVQQEDEDLDLTAVRDVIIEVDKIIPRPQGLNTVAIQHKYGLTVLIQTAQIRFERVLENGDGLLTVKQRYAQRYKAAVKNNGNAKLPVGLQIALAEFAFTHGLFEQFHNDMAELAKNHPAAAEAKSYLQCEESLKKSLALETNLLAWKDRLHGFGLERSSHYGVLYHLAGNQVEALQRARDLTKQLEDNYRTLYHWFALKGIELPQPAQRLVVILVDEVSEFNDLHKAFDEPPLAADGFFSRRDGVAVFSARPLDKAYDALEKSTRDLWRSGWNKERLLKGEGKAGAQPPEIAENQEKALLLKAMEDEALKETISQVGSRQLCTSLGLVPRAVAVPEWLQSGIGSFFETPKGSYWGGTSAPHWTYLVKYHVWAKKKKLDKPEVALRKVITDEYYRQALLSGNPDDMMRARTMSWALVFYLMQDRNRRPELRAYFDTLAQLPRDLDFDTEVLLRAFGKAFNCLDPKDPTKIDEAELARIASRWDRFIMDTPIEVQEAWSLGLKREELTEKKKEARFQPGFNPNAPVGPGGVPVGPGGVPVGPGGVPVGPGGRPGVPIGPGGVPPGRFPGNPDS